MTSLAIAVMILICGFVWGGFLVALGRALKSERDKVGAEPEIEA